MLCKSLQDHLPALHRMKSCFIKLHSNSDSWTEVLIALLHDWNKSQNIQYESCMWLVFQIHPKFSMYTTECPEWDIGKAKLLSHCWFAPSWFMKASWLAQTVTFKSLWLYEHTIIRQNQEPLPNYQNIFQKMIRLCLWVSLFGPNLRNECWR